MPTGTNPIARTLHDLGLAAWFGGSLMGAVGLNGASAEVPDPTDRTRVANAGWGRWMPVNALAIATHVLGSIQMIIGNKGRIGGQRGVGTATAVKTGLTAAALGATAYSGMLGQRVMKLEADYAATTGEGFASESGTQPAPMAPTEAQNAQRQLAALQWAIPALTGTLVVVSARMGEQQRPTEVARGFIGRFLPV